MCKVAETPGWVVKTIKVCRVFTWSKSVLDIGEGRNRDVENKSSNQIESIWA